MPLSDTSLVIPSAVYTAGVGSDVTLNLIGRDATGTRRRQTNTTYSDPTDLVIRHATQGSEKNNDAVDRHLIQLSSVLHETDGIKRQMVVNLTVAKPRSTLWTNANVQTRINMIANLILASGNLDAFLRGEA